MAEIQSKIGSVGSVQQTEVASTPMVADPLKSLIELGLIRDSITIGDKTFVLKSLNSEERVLISKHIKDISQRSLEKEFLDPEDIIEMSSITLAYSIETVNGMPLENLHPNADLDPINRKRQIIAQLQSPVIGQLNKKYKEIMDVSDGQFSVEEVKK